MGAEGPKKQGGPKAKHHAPPPGGRVLNELRASGKNPEAVREIEERRIASLRATLERKKRLAQEEKAREEAENDRKRERLEAEATQDLIDRGEIELLPDGTIVRLYEPPEED